MHFVLLLAAVLAVVCAARDYVPQRGDFTISTEVCYRCDNDDPSDCVADSIIIRLTDGVGRTTTMTTWAEPLDTVHWQGFGDVLEEDIDFDGIADLQVCNGPVNVFGNHTYTAYVWNQSTHSFVLVPNFEEINSFSVDREKRQIGGFWRLDNEVELSTYEWHDGKLVLVSHESLDYDTWLEE